MVAIALPVAVETDPSLRLTPVRDRDDGCRFNPSCEDCPFQVCINDLPAGARSVVSQLRRATVMALTASGWSAPRIAAELGISWRHVVRLRGETL